MKKRDADYGNNVYYPKRDYYRSSREAFGSFFPAEPRTGSSVTLKGILLVVVAVVLTVVLLRIYS